MKTQGPNVKRLIVHKISLLLIPPGTGANALEVAIGSLRTPGKVSDAAREATAWVEQAIAVVKTAPDNPYGDDDEAIAGEILRQVEEKQKALRARKQ